MTKQWNSASRFVKTDHTLFFAVRNVPWYHLLATFIIRVPGGFEIQFLSFEVLTELR